jgi:hypothetical protein
MHRIYASGQWALMSGIDGDLPPVCAITMSGAAGRRLEIRQYAGNPDLTLLLGKEGWAIPAGTAVDLALDIDGASVWRMHGQGAGTSLQGAIALADSGPFESAFRNGRAMRVSFPAGSEAPWIGNLIGSSAVFTAFNTCRATMPRTAQVSAPTQPFGGPPPATQPFTPAAAASAVPAPAPIAPSDLPPLPVAPK